MKNAEKETEQVTVDADLDKRYGNEPLFSRKIERVKKLLKRTSLDPATAIDLKTGA